MQVNVNAWLIFMAVSSLISGLVLFAHSVLSGTASPKRSAAFSALSLIAGIILGFLSAKLFFLLFRISGIFKEGIGGYLFPLRPSDLSYYGGLAGVILAVILAAKWTRIPVMKALNTFAFSFALLAAFIRFAEYWLGYLGTGGLEILFPGDIDDVILPFPFAMTEVFSEDYAECYLAVFMLEGVLSLRVAVFALQKKKDPLCFIRTLFCLCLFQVVCESMRDISLRWLFVRYEQAICWLVSEGILVWYGIVSAREKKWNFGAAIVGLIVFGLTVAEEYMLDGKLFADWSLPRSLIYGFMALGLLEMLIAEHCARKKLPNQTCFSESCSKP